MMGDGTGEGMLGGTETGGITSSCGASTQSPPGLEGLWLLERA